MASNKNSSKTAHVMNVLSKNRTPAPETAQEPKAEAVLQAAEPAPQAEPALQAAPPAAEPAQEPARTAPVAPLISSINADAAVSSQIKDALEAELAGEIPQTTAPAAPVFPEEPQESAPVQETPPAIPVQVETPVQQAPAAPVQDEPSQEESPREEPAKLASMGPSFYGLADSDSDEHTYVNVMQVLVDEKADQYMKMFGICCCDKCRVDVRALALNHLPPKYVVLSARERVPRLTVYENRFASDVTAQLIQACKQIMQRPHHSRQDD